jgi:hypothetical protein
MLHVKSVRYISEKLVWLSFDDGASGEVDLSGSLIGPIFEPLKDNVEFSKLYFDEELETIVWPNGADFAPEYLRELLDNQSPKKRSA